MSAAPRWHGGVVGSQDFTGDWVASSPTKWVFYTAAGPDCELPDGPKAVLHIQSTRSGLHASAHLRWHSVRLTLPGWDGPGRRVSSPGVAKALLDAEDLRAPLRRLLERAYMQGTHTCVFAVYGEGEHARLVPFCTTMPYMEAMAKGSEALRLNRYRSSTFLRVRRGSCDIFKREGSSVTVRYGPLEHLSQECGVPVEKLQAAADAAWGLG